MKLCYVFLTLLIGCQSRSIKNDLSTIQIVDKNSRKIQINNEDTAFGPVALGDSGEQPDNSSGIQKVFGLNISPLLYNSFLYVPIIKKLSANNLDIHVIGGYGFSAVIASLYANSKNINDFEWKIFKLYKKIEDHPAFSGKWQRQIRNFLTEEFKDKKIYELSRVLLIPRIKKNRVIYNIKNKVVDEVMFSLTSRSRSNYFANPIASIVSSFKRDSNCDICFNLGFSTNKLRIFDNNGDKLQIYSKILGRIKNNSDYILIEGIDSDIDRLFGLEIFYNKYDTSIEKSIESLKRKSINL